MYKEKFQHCISGVKLLLFLSAGSAFGYPDDNREEKEGDFVDNDGLFRKNVYAILL